ncbi:MAG: hypothetical protein JXB07_19360 [Anaerolineae bacterium]|nr:hypothetical protein [Anaerolineae bacterium]
MAKVRRNLVVAGLSGALGDQLIVKQYMDGRTIICKRPTFAEDRVFSADQKTHQQAFREASLYAKQAAKAEAIYVEKARGTSKNAYNIALGDWFHPPEIGEIDLSGWSGQVGEPIRVKALDDVMVKRVTLAIVDGQDEPIEQGEAKQVDELWWVYVTTQEAPRQVRVIAVAEDLPGNTAVQARDSRWA